MEPEPKKGETKVLPTALRLWGNTVEEQIVTGLAKYGTLLETHNGRDPLNDMAAELMDAWMYMTQARMERDDTFRELADLQGKLGLADDWRHYGGMLVGLIERWSQVLDEIICGQDLTDISVQHRIVLLSDEMIVWAAYNRRLLAGQLTPEEFDRLVQLVTEEVERTAGDGRQQ